MPWLAVLGSGSWMANGLRFGPGVHEVSEEIAEKARATGRRSLVVCDEQPELADAREHGPLKPEDLERPFSERGVQLKVVPLPSPEPLPEDEYALPKDYPCPQCSAKFPSSGSRERHVEFHH